MSTLKTHNLQSPDSGSANIALTANAGVIITGISTFNDRIDIGSLGVTTNFTVAGISTFTGNIIANGSVGIGTNNPAGGSSFHIHGSGASDKNHIRLTADRGLIARLGDTSSGAQAMFDLYDTDGSTQIVRFISGGGVNYINTGGKVGIGTDNPLHDLEVYNVGTGVTATSVVRGENAVFAIMGDATNTGASETDARLVFSSDGDLNPSKILTSPLSAHGFEIALINEEPGAGLRFHDGTANAERLRITSGGDVRVNVGNLVIATNNKGISFSGSTSSPDADATSNTRLLSDYDEGTIVWELHRSDGLTTGGNSSDTKTTYTKIGNRVYISGYVYTQSTGSSTGVTARLTDASGNAASLPYTPNHHGILPICHTRTIGEYERMSVSFSSGSKTVYVHTDESNNAYQPNTNNVNISSPQTHLVIAFTGSYTTDE